MANKITYQGVDWSFNGMQGDIETTEEAGTSTQRIIELKSNNGGTLFVRAKRIDNLHEAIVYQDLSARQLPIREFVPNYVGVFDSSFNPIALSERGQAEVIEEVVEEECEEQRSYWMLLEDVALNLPDSQKIDAYADRRICDFKFAGPALHGNPNEKKAHGHTNLHSDTYKLFKRAIFGISDCPFVYQQSCKPGNIFQMMIQFFIRLISILETKETIKDHFSSIDDLNDLKKVIGQLEKLAQALEESDYAFCDSSLLFVPTIGEDGKRSVDVHLIDLAHGYHGKENIDGFKESKEEQLEAIRYLIAKAKRVLGQRIAEASIQGINSTSAPAAA